MNILDLFIIQSTASLKEAFELLNKNGRGICIVVKEKKLVGILTDGDIRRFLLKTNDLKSNVHQAMNKNYLSLNVNSSPELIRKSLLVNLPKKELFIM